MSFHVVDVAGKKAVKVHVLYALIGMSNFHESCIAEILGSEGDINS